MNRKYLRIAQAVSIMAFVCAVLCVVMPVSCPASEAPESYETIRRNFGQPDTRFSGGPFFSWNDELDGEELVRQIREMHDKGLGGAFLHPRVGMITPYLSDEYFDMYGVCIREGKRLGFDIWLYDEEGWPSGSAGGRINSMGPEYVIKTLMCTEIAPGDIDSVYADRWTLGVYSADVDGETIGGLRHIPPGETAGGLSGKTILRTWIYFGRYGKLPNWYADILEPKAVDAFMELTHEAFRERFADEFGKTIPGIFTDEPNWSFLPWTLEFPEYFRSSKGYDIEPLLPLLFYRGEGYEKVRYDFYRAMTDRLVETYAGRIGKWSADNGFMLTGHMLHEDNLYVQTAHVGAVMPHYEFMQMPGIDHLSRSIADPLLPKQVSSVAHQMGNRRVLTETYGTAGWNVSFQDMKWIGEWQYVLGVNFPCQHLAHYSLRGVRKRDFPASLNYHQPWWPHYRYFNTYIARLLYMLTRGEHVADILVLHPIESAWLITDPKDPKDYRWDTFKKIYAGTEVDHLNDSLVSLSERLLEMHLDFDYGDESILSRHGSVERGRFRVGTSTYGTVIVPPCLTMRKTTLELLRSFAESGGRIVCIDPLPTLIEGESSPEPGAFLGTTTVLSCDMGGLKAALDMGGDAPIRITGTGGSSADSIYCHERIHNSLRLYFLVNISKDKPVKATVSFPVKGLLEDWNPENGAVTPVPCRIEGSRMTADFTFAAAESHLLVLREGAQPSIGERKQSVSAGKIPLGISWSFDRHHPNALTLDYCRYRLTDTGDWSGVVPVREAQRIADASKKNQDITLRFTFESDIEPPRDTWLVLETPELFSVEVNGSRIDCTETGYFHDRSFRTAPVGDALARGTNTIDLSCFFIADVEGYLASLDPGRRESERRRLRFGTELESIYITGDFGVRCGDNNRFAVTAPPGGTILTGDLGGQGFPFYAGNITYGQTVTIPALSSGTRAVLSCERIDAVVSVVRVNGSFAGYLAWRPLGIDITPFVKAGGNLVEIETAGSLRNLLGPHHHAEKEPVFTGPWHFEDSAKRTDAYNFVPFGITGDVSIRLLR